MNKSIHIIISCSLFILLSGCWDRVEIEQQGFVVGSALDLVNETDSEDPEIMLTNQFVVPSGLGTPAQGGSPQKAYSNLSASGKSIFSISREIATQTSRPPFYKHLQLVVVSSDIARIPNLFSNALDFFIRDNEMRRGIYVAIVDGEAKKVLEIKPETEKLPVMHISAIMDNSNKNATVTEALRVGELNEFFLSNSSYVVPKITVQDKKMKYESIAVFRGADNSMVGTLDAKEAMAYNMLTAKLKGGAFTTKLDGRLVSLEIDKAKRSMKITHAKKGNVGVMYDFNVTAWINESFSNKKLLNEKNLKRIGNHAAKKLEKQIDKTVEKVQQDLQVDIFGIGDRLRQHHYDEWKKIRDDWDKGENHFANTDIQVNAKVTVQSTSAAEQTNNK